MKGPRPSRRFTGSLAWLAFLAFAFMICGAVGLFGLVARQFISGLAVVPPLLTWLILPGVALLAAISLVAERRWIARAMHAGWSREEAKAAWRSPDDDED